MVRAHDDNGNVVDLVEWEEQIREEIKKELWELPNEYSEKLHKIAYEKGRADAIDEFADELKKYVVNKRMQGIEPYWAVAVYEVSEQLKEQNNE